MKAWLIIADVAAVIFMVIMLHTTYLEIQNYNSQYYEQRLMRSAEYACECAFYYASGSDDNQAMYINPAERVMSPKDILDNFDDIMALCYGMSTGQHSHTIIEDSIGTACLVTNDGFYITELFEKDENEFDLVWTPKIPYSADLNEIDLPSDNDNIISGTTYSVELSSEGWRSVVVNGSDYVYNHGTQYSEITGFPMTREIANRIIATKLTSFLAASVDHNTKVRNSADYAVFVPTGRTQSGINSMNHPTLLVVLKNAEYAHWDGIGATLAGFQLVTGTKVITYEKNGKMMYCYEGQGAKEAGYTVVKMYNTAEEAAADGCYPDNDYIFNAIKGATAD